MDPASSGIQHKCWQECTGSNILLWFQARVKMIFFEYARHRQVIIFLQTLQNKVKG